MKEIKENETIPSFGEVRTGDELLPRVAPNASVYGVYKGFRNGDYYANQSIAYRKESNGDERLLFGVKNATVVGDPIAYIHVMDLDLKKVLAKPRLNRAYHINDMMFSGDNANVILAPLDGAGDISMIRAYKYSDLFSQRIPEQGITPAQERSFALHFDNKPIDSLCKCTIKGQGHYLVKGKNKNNEDIIVFYDYNFNQLDQITIDQTDLHGDIIMTQTIEYYNGYILQVNAGDYTKPSMDKCTKNAYINVYRLADGSKVDTYRYPDTLVNMEAEGICCIGNGKYLFTHYCDMMIELRLLNFNTPSHTHILSDIFDLKTLKKDSGVLYVNPALEGNSYLAPDGSPDKPFPNKDEALAYAKLFLSSATIYLMNGNYGTVELSNVPMDVTFKGLDKAACLIDQIRISNCVNLQFEDLTFCDSERPFEVSSSTVELNNCSFPNGRQSGPGAAGNYGINMTKNSTVILQDCEISHFNSAVNIVASTLYLEGSTALQGTGNQCGLRGENSVIWGAENLDGKWSTSLTACRLDGEPVTLPFTPAKNICPVETGRPVNPETGCYYFESAAGKTLWWNGSAWIDGTGLEYLPEPA